jgi:diguanylate cyclase (GGDEF)-like protein/PAS domain S-box-containing protein
MVAAVDASGLRVPVPEHFGAPEKLLFHVPEGRETMLELVLEEDQLPMVTASEQADRTGIGTAIVHLRSSPSLELQLTCFDLKAEHGVMLMAMTGDLTVEWQDELDAVLAPPQARRPRTGFVRKNRLAVIVDVDLAMERMLGWTREELCGRRSSDLIHPEDQGRAISNWLEMLRSESGRRVRVRQRTRDGAWLWTEIDNDWLAEEDETGAVVVTQVSDISEEMAAHEAVRQREGMFRRLAESLPLGVCQVDEDNRIVYANEHLPRLLGLDAVRTVADLTAVMDEDDRVVVGMAFDQAMAGGMRYSLEVGFTRVLDGEHRRGQLTLAPLSGDDEGGAGALLSLTDITESARLRAQLVHQATHDALTGCLNRATVMAEAGEALRYDPAGTRVVFVDLDHFKPVNDRLGHASGDELLVHVAATLRAAFGQHGVVGRLGGDEFLVVLRGTPERDANQLAADTATLLARRIRLAAGEVEVRASVGAAAGEAGISADELVARADRAMYEAKRDRMHRRRTDPTNLRAI